MNALDGALNVLWAMEEGALTNLLNIAARQNDVTPEALEAYRAKSLDNAERAKVREGVAVLSATGPLFQRANLMTALSGATSYDVLRRDFQAALDDKSVKAILFNIDSPGGAASGVGELADAVYAARGQKPIVAYVGGMGASAAYNLASAADRIVIDPSAILGSIGVQWAMTDTTEADAKRGVKTFKFVSSQSPMKNADPGTEAGANAMQKTVDDMAQVFVESVARNRGVATETVLKDFGKGGIFVGKDAVKAGLADALGNFESVFAELASGPKSTRKQGISMSENTDKPAAEAKPAGLTAEDVAKAVAEATAKVQATERTRMSGLRKIATAHGVSDEKLNAAIDEGKSVEAFALEVAAAASEAGKTKVEALKRDEAEASGIKPAEPASGEKTADQLAAEIVASSKLAAGFKS